MTTYDSNYSKRVLLLHCDGTNASTTFTDNSSTPKTVTAYGNAQIATAQSKFGGASGYFDGSGDYLQCTDSGVRVGSANATIEFWIYPTSNATDKFLYSQYSNATENAGRFYTMYTTTKKIGMQLGSSYVESTSTFEPNNWIAVAITRSGTTWTLYVNGNSEGSFTSSATPSNVYARFGAMNTNTDASPSFDASAYFQGYLDELRVSLNQVEYTGNYTPATEAFGDSAPPAPNPPPLLNISQQACVNAGFIYAAGL